jgi:acetate---CoA ligase (ADP-forming)
MLELGRGEFRGPTYPVNPKYDEILGRRCYPDLHSIGEPVDLVLLGVPNARLEEQLGAAAHIGARAAVIFSTGFEPARAGTPPLTERLSAIARGADMAVCGGNCMGFLNLETGLRACGYFMPESLRAGPIAFISHSGSAFAAIAHNARDLRFNLLVSAGQEFVTTTADYIHYALGLDSTGVVALFLETVRDPANLRSALERAAQQRVPVVAIKVGRTERSRQLVAAHSGALAGDDGAYEALFDEYGVTRVAGLDEMADILELFAAGRRADSGDFASIHDSGGERALAIDVAADVGLRFAHLTSATRNRIASVLDEGLEPDNPVDAWGTGNDAEHIYFECMAALNDDPNVAAIALGVDLTTEVWGDESYVAVAQKAFASGHKPFAVMSNLAAAIDRADARTLRDSGVPVLEGTHNGMKAFRALFAYRDFTTRAPVPDFLSDVARRERWSSRLADPQSEADALGLIASYGIPVVKASVAADERGALESAHRIGFPVVVKTAEGVAHKSDAGGVWLDVADDDGVRAAYRSLSTTFGPRVTVAEQARPGVELALGIVNDDQFGPLVVAGAGGTLVELLADRRVALPPLDEARARRMIDSLRIRPLLDGVRGAPACDIDAVARTLVGVSHLACELRDSIGALDVNPLIATDRGCVAVDALVVPRS